MVISRCYLPFYATSGSSIKSQVLDLKTLPIFSPLKISVKLNKSTFHFCEGTLSKVPKKFVGALRQTVVTDL